ncbi:MAG: 5-formyltetrahydrofolate cyclo-ligase [Spirochaetaceae bacterium]|nr:5-formyltetrahydrofolate cyclo-ligase [Spirochaetaceae bacterium]
MTIHDEKAAFRRRIKSLIDTQSSSQLSSQQDQAIQLLLESELYKKSTIILAYVATKNEFSLHPLIHEAMIAGKRLALPKCNPHDCSMEFYRLDNQRSYLNQVETGAFGILEPVSSLPQLDVRQLPDSTLVLVPALAFTLQGQRLGRGKGFYDRYLQRIPGIGDDKSLQKVGVAPSSGPFCIGVAYSCQIVETIPTEENDVAMDYLLTPEGLIAKQE